MKISFLHQVLSLRDKRRIGYAANPPIEIGGYKYAVPTGRSVFGDAGILKSGITGIFGILGIFGIFGILTSCNSKPTPSVSHAASPFDTTHFETQTLTAEDRAKLANATGKTVQPIEIDALSAKINNATGKLHLFCFWNLGSNNSVSTLKAVNSLSAKFDSTKLHIVFVNMPGRQTMEDINLFIRENQLSDETLILEKADVSFFSKRIRKDFTGVTALPVIILANKADETLLFYNRIMDEKELSAIIQPLM
jgi:hypothetical protein